MKAIPPKSLFCSLFLFVFVFPWLVSVTQGELEEEGGFRHQIHFDPGDMNSCISALIFSVEDVRPGSDIPKKIRELVISFPAAAAKYLSEDGRKFRSFVLRQDANYVIQQRLRNLMSKPLVGEGAGLERYIRSVQLVEKTGVAKYIEEVVKLSVQVMPVPEENPTLPVRTVFRVLLDNDPELISILLCEIAVHRPLMFEQIQRAASEVQHKQDLLALEKKLMDAINSISQDPAEQDGDDTSNTEDSAG